MNHIFQKIIHEFASLMDVGTSQIEVCNFDKKVKSVGNSDGVHDSSELAFPVRMSNELNSDGCNFAKLNDFENTIARPNSVAIVPSEFALLRPNRQ